MAAGKSRRRIQRVPREQHAAMEPGRGGREEAYIVSLADAKAHLPLWSPAVAAGKRPTDKPERTHQ